MKPHCPLIAAFGWRRDRPSVFWILIVALVACGLGGCASRPGSEVLTPTVQASVPGARIMTIYVAAPPASESLDGSRLAIGWATELTYAEYRISIPPRHQAGHIEWPRGTPDAATSFVVLQRRTLDKSAFEQRTAPRKVRNGRSDTVVFVHGYNTSFQQSLFGLAQMTADAGFDGVAILFAWPSEAKVSGYIADKDTVTYARDGLVELLTGLARPRAKGTITVFGHSMGGWLTVEALRQLRLTGKNDVIDRLDVILAAPDIDVDVFRAQMEVVGPLSPPMMVLVSRDDVALLLSSRIAGSRQRLGTLNVDDPRVAEIAKRAKLQIVDISALKASDGLNHDRYVGLAALYSTQAPGSDNGAGQNFRQAGAFVFNTVGTTLSSPFKLVGTALAGQ